MEKRNYWLDIFNWTTWHEFLDAGGNISGFKEKRWNSVQKIKPGDYLLCYLTGVSRWIGILEVISRPFKDETPIWKSDIFPCRLKVKIVTSLKLETAIPVLELKEELSLFKKLENPNRFGLYFRNSPAIWEVSEGEKVVKAVQYAEKNPVKRPVDPAKLARKPVGLKAPNLGTVTIPDDQDNSLKSSSEPTDHTEIQWILLKLGNDMGLNVWVARNDRGRNYKGNSFADLPHIINDLPLQFDEATTKTIELIDVLWLEGNAIVAAFEIESTSSIYSGLLRMSDLVSMQPNITIPLYIVAPDKRRDKVISEVNRPTFSHLSPPLNEICRYIPFSELKNQISTLLPHIRHVKPAILEDLSESCETDDL